MSKWSTISKKTSLFQLDQTDNSRYQQILDLTLFHKSKDLPLMNYELKFDPIYDNMVFMMKYTVVLLEKVKRFLEKKHHDKDYKENGASNKYQADLRHHERKQLKTITYRAMYYIAQIRNYLLTIIQKKILTPRLFLLYNKERPGQFKTLTDMQTEINSLKFEEFIKINRDQLKYIGVFFKKNMMKILTIRMFKRIITSRYLQSTILLAKSYFNEDYMYRSTICEFFYYYNLLIDLFYLYMPQYTTVEYKIMKEDIEGSYLAIHKATPKLESSELPNVIRTNPRKPSMQELNKIEQNFKEKGMVVALGSNLLNRMSNNLKKNSSFTGDEKMDELQKVKRRKEAYGKKFQKFQEDLNKIDNQKKGDQIVGQVLESMINQKNDISEYYFNFKYNY